MVVSLGWQTSTCTYSNVRCAYWVIIPTPGQYQHTLGVQAKYTARMKSLGLEDFWARLVLGFGHR